MPYKVYHLVDTYDCETCGLDWAEGYIIEKDGKVVVDKTPVAHCYDGRDYSSDNPYKDIAELEGMEIEVHRKEAEE